MAELNASHVAMAGAATPLVADHLADAIQYLSTWPLRAMTHEQAYSFAIIVLAAYGARRLAKSIKANPSTGSGSSSGAPSSADQATKS